MSDAQYEALEKEVMENIIDSFADRLRVAPLTDIARNNGITRAQLDLLLGTPDYFRAAIKKKQSPSGKIK